MAKQVYGGSKPTMTKTGYAPNAPVKATPHPASHNAAASHASQQDALQAHAQKQHHTGVYGGDNHDSEACYQDQASGLASKQGGGS